MGAAYSQQCLGDINSLSVRGVDLHFVRKRERYSAEEGLSHGKGVGRLLRQRGGYYF